jgi:hypothetical protein
MFFLQVKSLLSIFHMWKVKMKRKFHVASEIGSTFFGCWPIFLLAFYGKKYWETKLKRISRYGTFNIVLEDISLKNRSSNTMFLL